MTISVQSTREKLADLQAYLKALLPSIDISLHTDVGARLQSLAQALTAMDYNAQVIEDNIFPEDCDDTSLIKHGEGRLGTNSRKSATKSSGTVTITGSVSSTIESGETLTHSSGTTYQITEDGTIPSGGTLTGLNVESISTGTQCNLDVGEELTFDSPPVGINSTATVEDDGSGDGLTGGLDQEPIDEYRERVVDAFANPIGGGRASDYRQWALEVDDVYDAYVYCPHDDAEEGRSGLGTVDIAILKSGTGSAREPSQDIVDECQDYMLTKEVCTDDVTIILPNANGKDVEIQIDPIDLSAYDWDWNDAGGHTVSSWDAPNKKITWTLALPETLKNKIDSDGSARFMIADKTTGIVYAELVTAVAYDSPAKTTTLEDTPTNTPASTHNIYPAGPLTQPIIDAIIELFDTFGPARYNTPKAAYAADPNQIWEDTLRLSELNKVVKSVTGVKDLTIITPAMNQTSSDTGGASGLDFITYDAILIRPS